MASPHRFNPARFSVARWQFTLLAFALFALMGLTSLRSVPRTEDPQFPIPVVQINAVLPGADPLDMEQLVGKPLEDALDGLDDVREVRTTASDGVAVVVVEFGWDTNPERKYDEVVREVNALRPTLPTGLTRLEVRRFRTTEAAITQVALVSDALPWRRLEKIAENLQERIDRVPGVRETRLWGAPESEVRVALDLGRLAALNIPVTQVADALRNAGLDTPLGAVHAGARRFNVKTQGAFKSLDAVKDTAVLAQAGRVVRVRDIAQVSWQSAEPSHLTYYNGKRALFVTATQKDGEDVIRLQAAIDQALDEFSATLPGNVKLERAFRQSDNVEARLSRLYKDFVIALALVLITLLPLGLRASLVVMLSIPLSLLIGVSVLNMLGFSINQLTIAGFILSLGLLVDDSIVVIENIARHLREGKSRLEAAVEGTGQIAIAVLGCTATLMLAFTPLLFLPEGSGQFIRSLPAAVLVTVAASLLVSLTIIPFLASGMLSAHENPEGNALLQAVNRGIHRLYQPILHAALEKPWRALFLTLALCATAIPILGIIGSSLFPPAGTRQFLVRIETPQGTALARTGSVLKRVEAVLAKTPEVEWTLSNLGRGNPQIYYNIRQHETAPNYAEAYVQLKEWDAQRSPKLIDTLRAQFNQIAGAQINVIVFENGPPIEAPIAVRIRGEDIATLQRLSIKATQIIETTPGTRDVVNPLRLNRTDLNLGIDEAKAAALGVPAGAAKRIARLALTGEVSARYRDPDGDDYAVRVRLPQEERNTLSALAQIYVPTASGTAAPLNQIATPTLQSSPARIDRFQRLRTVTLTAYAQTCFLTSSVTQNVLARLSQELDLPPGYQLDLGGQVEAQSRAFAGMTTAVLVVVFSILAVLLLEFGRFKTVLVVAGIIPFGLFGAVLALWITGNSLSFTATIGLIALIGIEIKNSILLVDFTEQLRREGMALREAIERAGEVRFLPVLLTSLTAIGGLIPLALEGSGLYSPMAIAIIGGLISSTLLSRVATPVMYLLLAKPWASKKGYAKSAPAQASLKALHGAQ